MRMPRATTGAATAYTRESVESLVLLLMVLQQPGQVRQFPSHGLPIVSSDFLLCSRRSASRGRTGDASHTSLRSGSEKRGTLLLSLARFQRVESGGSEGSRRTPS